MPTEAKHDMVILFVHDPDNLSWGSPYMTSLRIISSTEQIKYAAICDTKDNRGIIEYGEISRLVKFGYPDEIEIRVKYGHRLDEPMYMGRYAGTSLRAMYTTYEKFQNAKTMNDL